MKRKWTRKLFSGLSLTTALFVFQACYGSPQDFENDLLVEGKVVSKSTGDAIKNIQILTSETMQSVRSGEDGYFAFYTPKRSTISLQIRDIDSTENRQFASKDTVLNDVAQNIYVDILLDEQ